MHEDIKKYVDEGNIKGLKYSFSNSLDVDPTFEKYRDDFEYCKNVFEEHRELTKFESNHSNFDDNYWVKLKKDLFENFSQKRLEHMIEVAQVIYKDKIERLKRERKEAKKETIKKNSEQQENEEDRKKEQQEIERLRQKQIEEAKKKNNLTGTDEKKGKTDSQSLKPSNNEGNIAGSVKKSTQKPSTSETKKVKKTSKNGSQKTKDYTTQKSETTKSSSKKDESEKTSEDLRQKQIEEAQKKLRIENNSTEIIINNDNENKKTLNKLMKNNHEIANDPDNIIYDVALTGAATFGVAAGVTYGASKTLANGIDKIINKSKK